MNNGFITYNWYLVNPQFPHVTDEYLLSCIPHVYPTTNQTKRSVSHTTKSFIVKQDTHCPTTIPRQVHEILKLWFRFS